MSPYSFIAILIVFLCSSGSLSQNSNQYLDSLYSLVETSDNDSVIAKAHHLIGKELNDLGVYDQALQHHKQALAIRYQLGDYSGTASSYNSLGAVSRSQGDYQKAMEYYYQSLRISEQINDRSKQAMTLNNIGVVYLRQKDYPKSREYFRQALAIDYMERDTEGIAYDYVNLAISFTEMQQFDSAVVYNLQAKNFFERKGSLGPLIQVYNTIGSVHWASGAMDSAKYYYQKGLDIALANHLTEQIVLSNILVSSIDLSIGKFEDAVLRCQEALQLAESLGNDRLIQSSCDCISYGAEGKGDYKMALEYYQKVVQLDKEVFSTENEKKFSRLEIQHEYDQKASLLRAENMRIAVLAEEKEKQQSIIIISVLIGLFLLTIFFFVLLKRYQLIRFQKVLIEQKEKEAQEQRDLVVEKNQEIMDSIAYAKRIQSAILPPQKLVKEYLNESFILYKPKDVVAGDFYWMAHADGKVLFAAADCTGHGVPGAMVSVICNGGLNRSVNEFGLTDPGQILDKTRELVIKEFEKSEEEVKDGMDIALCSLSVAELAEVSDSSTRSGSASLQYAGAHNALWIIRHNKNVIPDGDPESHISESGVYTLEEIKADKQPIGKYAEEKPFTTKTVELHKGDSIYIFSDGYADQFGGDKGKKFKAANFKDLLISIQNETMERQRELLDEAIEKWRGSLEQVDDICVIGVRV